MGLLAAGSPRAGLLAATLVPLAAGWAVMHGQHAAAYSALSWLSRADTDPAELPADLARAVAEALSAPGTTLWIGSDELRAVGVWPESDAAIAPTTLAAFQRQAGHLDGLSPRERDVLELMARGRSNAAICDELHLSSKTVEPIVSTIFTRLGLHADAASNRRVLAVLAYVRT